MNMSLYDMIYVITNTFGVYIIYKFMTVFFDRKNALVHRIFPNCLCYLSICENIHNYNDIKYYFIFLIKPRRD